MTKVAGGLIEAIRASMPPRGGGCGVAKIMAAMDKALADELRAALDMADLPGQAIAAELKRRGFDVAGNTIQRHRRKVCSCEPG